jgi:hypothetical protein
MKIFALILSISFAVFPVDRHFGKVLLLNKDTINSPVYVVGFNADGDTMGLVKVDSLGVTIGSIDSARAAGAADTALHTPDSVRASHVADTALNTPDSVRVSALSWNSYRLGGHDTTYWDTVGDGAQNGLFLRLDQTTPQTVVNGAPLFNLGLRGPRWYPASDGAAAIQITKADGTTGILYINTTTNYANFVGNLGVGASSYNSLIKLNVLFEPTVVSEAQDIAGYFGCSPINDNVALFQAIGLQMALKYYGAQGSTSAKGCKALDCSAFNYNTGTTTWFAGAKYDIRNLGAGTITNLAGDWISAMTNSGGGAVTNTYGLRVDAQSVGTNNYGVYLNNAYAATNYNIYCNGTADNVVKGNLNILADNKSVTVGAAGDAGYSYDGSNAIYNSRLIGTGNHNFTGGTVNIENIPTSGMDTVVIDSAGTLKKRLSTTMRVDSAGGAARLGGLTKSYYDTVGNGWVRDSLDKHADTLGKYKDHANLNNLNSANYTHLTATSHTDLTDAGYTALHKHSRVDTATLSDSTRKIPFNYDYGSYNNHAYVLWGALGGSSGLVLNKWFLAATVVLNGNYANCLIDLRSYGRRADPGYRQQNLMASVKHGATALWSERYLKIDNVNTTATGKTFSNAVLLQKSASNPDTIQLWIQCGLSYVDQVPVEIHYHTFGTGTTATILNGLGDTLTTYPAGSDTGFVNDSSYALYVAGTKLPKSDFDDSVASYISGTPGRLSFFKSANKINSARILYDSTTGDVTIPRYLYSADNDTPFTIGKKGSGGLILQGFVDGSGNATTDSGPQIAYIGNNYGGSNDGGVTYSMNGSFVSNFGATSDSDYIHTYAAGSFAGAVRKGVYNDIVDYWDIKTAKGAQFVVNKANATIVVLDTGNITLQPSTGSVKIGSGVGGTNTVPTIETRQDSLWINGTLYGYGTSFANISGSGTANRGTMFTATNEIGDAPFTVSTNLVTFDSNFTAKGKITSNVLTALRAVVTDPSKGLVSSATTSTEIGYVSGVTSSIQTQLGTKLNNSNFDDSIGHYITSANVACSLFSGTRFVSAGTGKIARSGAIFTVKLPTLSGIIDEDSTAYIRLPSSGFYGAGIGQYYTVDVLQSSSGPMKATLYHDGTVSSFKLSETPDASTFFSEYITLYGTSITWGTN